MLSFIVTLAVWMGSVTTNAVANFIPSAVEDAPTHCYQAVTELGLSAQQGILLCTNAVSGYPIHCLRDALRSGVGLTPDQSIHLCQGANSEIPFECFEKADHWSLTLDQRTKLCSEAGLSWSEEFTSTQKSIGPLHCYTCALDLQLSQDQRIILCANATSEIPIRCFERTKDLGLSSDQRVRLCTQLSPSSW